MQQITLRSRVGEDGILHLDIPIEMRETDLEVTIMVKPIFLEQTKTEETLSEARERLLKVRQKYDGRIFMDSTELLKEDRQR